jgi:ComF family protein
VHDVVDFFYPASCASCRQPCHTGSFLCDVCFGQLRRLESAAACPLCAMPVAQNGAPCPFCQGEGLRHYDSVLRLGTFDDPLKDLIHKMKYQGRWILCEQLAERLRAQDSIKALLAQAQVLVPVPLHMLRQFHRGYNQASVIAARLAKLSGVPMVWPIRRVRRTQTQTHLHSRQKRAENLRDAFRLVRPSSIRGMRVLVIDDVMTTGATLQAVARALRPARPASVSALVIAVADPRGRGFQVV